MFRLLRKRSRKFWILAAALLALLVIGLTIVAINPSLTRYVESAGFRAALEMETAKGLHFPSAEFAPIERTGVLGAHTEKFAARDGRKAMTAINASDINARFNPLGIFLRRWQLDELHVDHAQIGIHVYEPKPEPRPSKPWYHIFLPDRVYLKRVWSDDVDLTWPAHDQTAGIFKTHLEITPHGRDFVYRATGGTLKNPPFPDLAVRKIDILITKKVFTLYQLEVVSGDGRIHADGTTGVSGDRGADFSFNWNDVPLAEWIPKSWDGKYSGLAKGHFQWTGQDYKLGSAAIAGEIELKEARVSDLKFLDDIAAIANHPDLARLDLDQCRSHFRWREHACELSDIAIEEKGKFRIEGNISLAPDSLGGALELGVAPEYLDWLPHAGEVFTQRRGDFIWTTMHLSGTLDAPQQDLSPRLLDALKESPGALIGAAFRALGAWLKGE